MSSVQTPSAPADEASASRRPLSLSVILPNFNHGRLIPRALRALLSQTPSAKEIIVVDDGSTDDSVRIIEAIARDQPPIKLIRNTTNQGIIASVKTALAAATGDHLLFASSDDFVLPGLFARAQAGFRDNPQAAFFCSRVALVDGTNRVIGVRPFTLPRRDRGYLSPDDVRRVIKSTDFWVLGTATVLRRAPLAEIGYFDPKLGSLGDVLAYRLLAFRHGFYFDPAVLAVYNKDPMSYSGRNAMSVGDTRRLLAAAQSWMAENLPADVRDDHARLFDRRMRFGLARLWAVWRQGRLDSDAMADILGVGRFDRMVLAAVARVPVLSSFLALGWITVRTPPFSPAAIAAGCWRALSFRCFGHAAVARQIAAVDRSGRS
jgi:glycosyltransferase involved in cell wall biosynthesis